MPTISAAIALVMLLLASGCSTPPESEPEYSAQETHARVALGVALPGEFEESIKQGAREVEELMVKCMTVEGFEYIPALPEALVSGFRDLSVREEVAVWGFSISTVDYDELEPEVENPNMAVYLSLSPEEQQAWNDQYTVCSDGAEQQIYVEQGLDSVDAVVETIDRSVENAAPVLDALDHWSRCMKESGWDFVTERELIETLRAEFADLEEGMTVEFKKRELEAALMSFDCGSQLRDARAVARDEALAELSPSWMDAITTE